MYGAPSRTAVNATGTPIQTPQQARSNVGPDAQAHAYFPFFLVALVLLYIVYAIVEQHQRVRSAIKPENAAVNLRNIVIMLLTVVLGINVLKIAAAKMDLWFGSVPIVGQLTAFGVKLMGGV